MMQLLLWLSAFKHYCIRLERKRHWNHYSFSRLPKHISRNYASYSQNSKHESITSNSIPQMPYIQVKMKLSAQNNSILLRNQTLLLDVTHKQKKHTHFNTVLHTDEINSKQYYNKSCLWYSPNVLFLNLMYCRAVLEVTRVT